MRRRREADATEQRGEHLLSIAVLLVNGRHYDKAVLDGKSLLAEAAALREHAAGLASRAKRSTCGSHSGGTDRALSYPIALFLM
jgi:hypothetical protein